MFFTDVTSWLYLLLVLISLSITSLMSQSGSHFGLSTNGIFVGPYVAGIDMMGVLGMLDAWR
jgi:hypothetical protein